MRPKRTAIFALFLALIMTFTLVACDKTTSLDIPEVLQKTVGTVSNTSTTTGIKDGDGYQSLLIKTFTNTTEADYTSLMEHYQSASIGTNEDGSLLFDWGWLYITPDNGSITINAYFK